MHDKFSLELMSIPFEIVDQFRLERVSILMEYAHRTLNRVILHILLNLRAKKQARKR